MDTQFHSEDLLTLESPDLPILTNEIQGAVIDPSLYDVVESIETESVGTPNLTIAASPEEVVKVTSKTRSTEPKKSVQISIAEYMYKNIQLLGFENHARVINVAVRELMDNALDAANQSHILPKVYFEVKYLKDKKYRIIFKDYGPGVDAKLAPNICGRLLYGNKFNQPSAQRGCQGIGLTALILYCQKTTGTAAKIIVKDKYATTPTELQLKINLKTNRPDVLYQKKLKADNPYYKADQTGFMVVIDVVASYQKKGPKATVELLRQYSYLNPNLELKFVGPDETSFEIERLSEQIIPPGSTIKSVPHHLQIGDFLNFLNHAQDTSMIEFLEKTFEGKLKDHEKILSALQIPKNLKVKKLNRGLYLDLLDEYKVQYKDLKPEPGVLVDLGPCIKTTITKGGTIHFDNVLNVRSDPIYYQKGVLQIELSAFYGGPTLSNDQKIEVYRVANGMPLLYQSTACAITRTLIDFNWKKLGLTHVQNELPRGKLILFVHINSTSIPFITESKDAIAGIDVIKQTITSGLEKLGKLLNSYMKKEDAHQALMEKNKIIKNIIPDLLETLRKTLNRQKLILDGVKVEKLQARIYELLCFYKNKSNGEIRVYNETNKPHKLNFVEPSGERTFFQILPYENKVIPYIDKFYLEDILPIEYLIIDVK